MSSINIYDRVIYKINLRFKLTESFCSYYLIPTILLIAIQYYTFS